MNIEKEVFEKIHHVIEENGYILDSVSYLKEDGNQFLRVVIDKNEGITIDDCVIVTKLINPIVDEIEINEDNYILDVCSKERGCE